VLSLVPVTKLPVSWPQSNYSRYGIVGKNEGNYWRAKATHLHVPTHHGSMQRVARNDVNAVAVAMLKMSTASTFPWILDSTHLKMSTASTFPMLKMSPGGGFNFKSMCADQASFNSNFPRLIMLN
jgi:hypothetical protein